MIGNFGMGISKKRQLMNPPVAEVAGNGLFPSASDFFLVENMKIRPIV